MTNVDYQVEFLPFGKQSTQEKSHGLVEIRDPSSVWAVGDFDAKSVQDVSSLGSLNGKPKADSAAKTPAHGASRTFFLFDGRAGPRKVQTYKEY